MKKNHLLCIAFVSCLFVLPMNAQVAMGKWMISGSSAINFTAETDKYKSDNGDGTSGRGLALSFDPQIGYFVIDNLAAGLLLEMNYQSYKADGADDRESESYLIMAPFARYYLGSSKIRPFAEAAVGIGPRSSKYITFDGTEKDRAFIFTFQMKGGASVFLNDNVALDMGIGYRYISNKNTDDNPDNYRYIMSNFIMQIGFTIIW